MKWVRLAGEREDSKMGLQKREHPDVSTGAERKEGADRAGRCVPRASPLAVESKRAVQVPRSSPRARSLTLGLCQRQITESLA